MKNKNTDYMGQTSWYVYPSDNGKTNALLASTLPKENFSELYCTDKRVRPLWRCDFELLHHVIAREKTEQLNFRVYMSYESAPPQLFPLEWMGKSNNQHLIVLAHPVQGDKERNLAAIWVQYEKLCRNRHIIPWFPFDFLKILDNDNKDDRQNGIFKCISMVKMAKELWLYGPRISNGMKNQIFVAGVQGIPIKAKSAGTRRDLALLSGNLEEYKKLQ